MSIKISGPAHTVRPNAASGPAKGGAIPSFANHLDQAEQPVEEQARAARLAGLQVQLRQLEAARKLFAMTAESEQENAGFALPSLAPAGQNFDAGDRGGPEADRSVAAASRPTRVDAPADLDAIISRAARAHGVEEGLIRSVIRTESAFNPRAVSPAGAQGLMQLMPGTARDLGVNNPFDPEQNVMAGTRYLRQLLDRYQGDLDRSLAAYNWGMGNVDRHGMERLPRETRDYLVRVKSA
jgi:soluble lytic murein transglycosylase-like protein